MSNTNVIRARLSRQEEPERKLYSIPLKPEIMAKMDVIAKALTRSSGRTTTRNMLIEDILHDFVTDAPDILADEGIQLDSPQGGSFDTIICPARMNEDYEHAFFVDHEWRFVKIRKEKLTKIQYIALYVGAPQSSISHYARVAPNGFTFDEAEKGYRIRLDGAPIPLPHPVPKGTASASAVRTMKYTTLEQLLTANDFREAYERRS